MDRIADFIAMAAGDDESGDVWVLVLVQPPVR